MILYVDETESDTLFIVSGLLVKDRQDIEQIFKRFKKKAQQVSVSKKYKTKLFSEFKSVIMDKEYQQLKKVMLTILNEINYHVFYGCLIKIGEFKQKDKERAYINILSAIVSSIYHPVDVYFDSFRNRDFERSIIKKLESMQNVRLVKPTISETDHGIIMVDNLCSVIRRHEMNQYNEGFFNIITHSLKKV